MLQKLILLLMAVLFLNACQTHLPVISQMEGSESTPCPEDMEQIELADIDYLLYANKMVDAMIQDENVQKEMTTNRLTLSIQAIRHENNTAQVDMDAVNSAVKNRILRSGQFIIVDDEKSADFQLSGVFENKETYTDNCVGSYEQFSMQLKKIHTGETIWTEKKQFK